MPDKSKGASHKKHVPVSSNTEQAPSSTTESSVPIVGVGASAEGLAALDDARIYAEDIVNTVREPLVVLDMDLQVVSANQAFYDTFMVKPEETVGRRIYELGNNQWDIPRLRELLEKILPTNQAFNDFEVEHTFEQLGRRTMLLNARRIDSKQLMLLAIEDVTRRKEAEVQLEQEKNLTQLYLNVAGVIMVALDRQGHVTMINQTGCEMLGYSKAEVVGKNWFAHFLPERDREPVRKAFLVLMTGDVAAEKYVENLVLTKSGEERLILWHNAVVQDEQGKVVNTLSSGTDITERKQAKATNQRLAAIVESSEDAIIGQTLNGIITHWNRGAVQMYGYVEEEVVGKPITIIVPEDRRGEVANFLATIERGERVAHFETVRIRKDGSRLDVSLGISPVYDLENRLMGISAIARDVTQRKKAEAALMESQARVHAIFETSVDAVITIDEHGIIESANPATERLFGYTTGEMIGQNVKMLMPAPYHDEHDQYLRNYLETGQKKIIGLGREVVARRKDGSTFPVDLAVSEVRFGNQRIFTGFIRDISERQHLQREVLRISEDERQRIGQDIHDGLASLFSGMALMGRGLVNRQMQGRPLDLEMLEELTRLARMGAEQARALARGLSPMKLDKEGLPAALKELVYGAEILSDMACTIEMDEALPPLKNNVATQLYRIAQEAVNNAIKHADARHLVLKVHKKEEHLVLTVSDDGAGIPADREEAEGLGLHIMPYRARMLGASLTIDSRPGTGTSVICLMPLTDDRPTA